MTVIPQYEIDMMIPVMDTILKYPNLKVNQIKERYGLNSAEYEMIFDLTMPLLREANVKKYWAIKYSYITRKIMELLMNEHISDKQFRKRVMELLSDPSAAEPAMFEATGLTDCMEERNA